MLDDQDHGVLDEPAQRIKVTIREDDDELVPFVIPQQQESQEEEKTAHDQEMEHKEEDQVKTSEAQPVLQETEDLQTFGKIGYLPVPSELVKGDIAMKESSPTVSDVLSQSSPPVSEKSKKSQKSSVSRSSRRKPKAQKNFDYDAQIDFERGLLKDYMKAKEVGTQKDVINDLRKKINNQLFIVLKYDDEPKVFNWRATWMRYMIGHKIRTYEYLVNIKPHPTFMTQWHEMSRTKLVADNCRVDWGEEKTNLKTLQGSAIEVPMAFARFYQQRVRKGKKTCPTEYVRFFQEVCHEMWRVKYWRSHHFHFTSLFFDSLKDSFRLWNGLGRPSKKDYLKLAAQQSCMLATPGAEAAATPGPEEVGQKRKRASSVMSSSPRQSPVGKKSPDSAVKKMSKLKLSDHDPSPMKKVRFTRSSKSLSKDEQPASQRQTRSKMALLCSQDLTPSVMESGK